MQNVSKYVTNKYIWSEALYVFHILELFEETCQLV